MGNVALQYLDEVPVKEVIGYDHLEDGNKATTKSTQAAIGTGDNDAIGKITFKACMQTKISHKAKICCLENCVCLPGHIDFAVSGL